MKGLWCGVLLFWGFAARAQTFAEWFQQTKTERKYYLEQLAALQTYTLEAEKGYSILQTGLSTIRGIDSGEFDLHRGYYESLSTINPVVGNMGAVKEIVNLQELIVGCMSSALKRYRGEPGLTAGDLDYINRVFATVLDAGMTDVDQLTDILTPGRLKMLDDERMGFVDGLDRVMKVRFGFSIHFIDQVDMVCLQRKSRRVSSGMVGALYGLP